jgi:hypothetical protein
MALLAEHNVTAIPGRRVLEVYDADAYLGDEAARNITWCSAARMVAHLIRVRTGRSSRSCWRKPASTTAAGTPSGTVN